MNMVDMCTKIEYIKKGYVGVCHEESFFWLKVYKTLAHMVLNDMIKFGTINVLH